MLQTSINSLTTQKMIGEHIQTNTFTPPLHTLLGDVKKSLNQLLETFKLQICTGWNKYVGQFISQKMQIDMGDSKPVLQRPHPLAMKHYNWVRSEINKLPDAQVICSSHSSWSASIRVVPKGEDGKCLVIDYRALNKVTWKFVWPVPRVKRYLFKAKWC